MTFKIRNPVQVFACARRMDPDRVAPAVPLFPQGNVLSLSLTFSLSVRSSHWFDLLQLCLSLSFVFITASAVSNWHTWTRARARVRLRTFRRARINIRLFHAIHCRPDVTCTDMLKKSRGIGCVIPRCNLQVYFFQISVHDTPME